MVQQMAISSWSGEGQGLKVGKIWCEFHDVCTFSIFNSWRRDSPHGESQQEDEDDDFEYDPDCCRRMCRRMQNQQHPSVDASPAIASPDTLRLTLQRTGQCRYAASPRMLLPGAAASDEEDTTIQMLYSNGYLSAAGNSLKFTNIIGCALWCIFLYI